MSASQTLREPSTDTHAAIIRAAERLFAARGIEGVSLREIMREAGQRNTTSLQYHFGNREGLLRALVEKHVQSVSLQQDAILDLLESHDRITLREACAALIQPLVAKLNDPDGGREFLQVAAQLINRADRLIDPDDPLGAIIYDRSGSQNRWRDLVEQLMPPGTAGSPLHRRFAAIRFVYIEMGRRASVVTDRDHGLFCSQLIDLCAALLGAEISQETHRLLDDRQSRKPS